jgi:hypothetical protein
MNEMNKKVTRSAKDNLSGVGKRELMEPRV